MQPSIAGISWDFNRLMLDRLTIGILTFGRRWDNALALRLQ